MSATDEQEIAAFSELVSAHRSRVFGYIYAMLHNMSDAEDVYQQTTVLMWEKFDSFKLGTDFGSWALKIAYYNVKNFQRSTRRRHVFFSDAVMERVASSFQSRDIHDAKERLDALGQCVGRLPDRHQYILRRRYAENTPIKELAAGEGKTEAAMSMLLCRLRKTIFHCVQARLVSGS
jgi:RNA polymerase sigma-70 factor (ECF subfamily)